MASLRSLRIFYYFVYQSTKTKDITFLQVKVQKEDVGFDLELLEHAATLVVEEDTQRDSSADLASGFQNLCLNQDVTDRGNSPHKAQEQKETDHDQTKHNDHEEPNTFSSADQSKSPTQGSDSSEYETDSDTDSASSSSVSSEDEGAEEHTGRTLVDDRQFANGGQSVTSKQNQAEKPQTKPRVLIEDITEDQ